MAIVFCFQYNMLKRSVVYANPKFKTAKVGYQMHLFSVTETYYYLSLCPFMILPAHPVRYHKYCKDDKAYLLRSCIVMTFSPLLAHHCKEIVKGCTHAICCCWNFPSIDCKLNVWH